MREGFENKIFSKIFSNSFIYCWRFVLLFLLRYLSFIFVTSDDETFSDVWAESMPPEQSNVRSPDIVWQPKARSIKGEDLWRGSWTCRQQPQSKKGPPIKCKCKLSFGVSAWQVGFTSITLVRWENERGQIWMVRSFHQKWYWFDCKNINTTELPRNLPTWKTKLA